MTNETKQNWNNATWTGSRRAMIRQSLKLTVRERLQALEELCKTARRLASIETTNNQQNSDD